VARLLADENFPLPVTEQLRAHGHDVVTLEELGKSDQRLADEAVLELAVAHGRALLTLNRRHFVRLHGERPDHAGIVVCSLDVEFARQAQRIADALEAAGPIERRLVRINRPG
jgi:predicted nuclease of predicted toxin-antitoxin system